MAFNAALHNDTIVTSLRHSLRSGTNGLSAVPDLTDGTTHALATVAQLERRLETLGEWIAEARRGH